MKHKYFEYRLKIHPQTPRHNEINIQMTRKGKHKKTIINTEQK